MVSDEVWQQLDPHAGRMSRRGFRVFCAAVVAAAAIAALTAAGWRTAVTPVELDWVVGGDAEAQLHPPRFENGFTVRNAGLLPVTITGVGGEIAGLRFDGVGGPALPVTLQPGESVYVRVRYAITNCDAVPSDPLPVHFHIDRPWGTQSIPVIPQSWGDEAWQVDLARMACHPDRP